MVAFQTYSKKKTSVIKTNQRDSSDNGRLIYIMNGNYRVRCKSKTTNKLTWIKPDVHVRGGTQSNMKLKLSRLQTFGKKKVELQFDKLLYGGSYNDGVTLWNVPTDSSTKYVGKTQADVKIVIQNGTADNIVMEALHAIYLKEFDFCMKLLGVFPGDATTFQTPGLVKTTQTPGLVKSSQTPGLVKTSQTPGLVTNTQKTYTAFFSHGGDPIKKAGATTQMAYMQGLADFLKSYENAAQMYGISHNDLHSSNLVYNGNKMMIIDYGRMHFFDLPKNVPISELDTVKALFSTVQGIDDIYDYEKLTKNNSDHMKTPIMHYNKELGENVYSNYILDLTTLCMNIYANIYREMDLSVTQRQYLEYMPIYIRHDIFHAIYISRCSNFNLKRLESCEYYPLLGVILHYVGILYEYIRKPILFSTIKGRTLKTASNETNATIDKQRFVNLNEISIHSGGWQFKHYHNASHTFLSMVVSTFYIPAQTGGRVTIQHTKGYKGSIQDNLLSIKQQQQPQPQVKRLNMDAKKTQSRSSSESLLIKHVPTIIAPPSSEKEKRSYKTCENLLKKMFVSL